MKLRIILFQLDSLSGRYSLARLTHHERTYERQKRLQQKITQENICIIIQIIL